MASCYLVCYGRMNHVGRFMAEADGFARGDRVVVRSCRGRELGTVLVRLPRLEAIDSRAKILRGATSLDFEALEKRQVELERLAGLDGFQGLLGSVSLLDVEPLLDERAIVVHFLGPPDLDVANFRLRFEEVYGLEPVFEMAGSDPIDTGCAGGPCSSENGDPRGCGDCGHCGHRAGCGDCGLSRILKDRRATPLAKS